MKDIMSYLRIQLTVAWLNFDHALSNSKKWPKGKKDQIAPIFSQKKQLIKFHVLAPFILRNFKKILRADPEL